MGYEKQRRDRSRFRVIRGQQVQYLHKELAVQSIEGVPGQSLEVHVKCKSALDKNCESGPE
jgi:hypothetical protein